MFGTTLQERGVITQQPSGNCCKKDDVPLSLWVSFLYRLNDSWVLLGIANAKFFTSLNKQDTNCKARTSKRNKIGGTSYLKYVFLGFLKKQRLKRFKMAQFYK